MKKVISLCCLGLIVFVGGCGLNKRTTVVPADNSRTAVQSSSEQVPDIERETPDEVADITTSVTVADGWTTYADAEYLFTMSYPETAELQEVGDSTRILPEISNAAYITQKSIDINPGESCPGVTLPQVEEPRDVTVNNIKTKLYQVTEGAAGTNFVIYIYHIEGKNGCVELRRNLGHGNTAVSGDSQGVIDDALAKEAKDMNEIINTFRFVD